MITTDDLLEIGFHQKPDTTDNEFMGMKCFVFERTIDNGHIIPMHDYTIQKVHVFPSLSAVKLIKEQISSWTGGENTIFKGRCPDIDFLQKVFAYSE